MVAIGPRGTAYTAAAFEIFADLYYRTSASINAALAHDALRGVLSDELDPSLRAVRATRLLAALRPGLAPALLHAGTAAAAIDPVERTAPRRDENGPAGFVLMAVWSRLAAASPAHGALGGAYLLAQFTAQAARLLLSRADDALPAQSGQPPDAPESASLAAEAGRVATQLRHLLLETLSADPSAASAILEGFDRLSLVFPLPLLDELAADADESLALA